MSRISPLNIVLTSVSLTIIGVTVVFGGIAPGLDFGTVLERMLVNSGVATDGTVKNADKVDGLHASDLLSAAGENNNGVSVVVQEFAANLGDSQSSCPVGWIYLRTGPNFGGSSVVCQKNFSFATGTGAPLDIDGDDIYDLQGLMYTNKFNANFLTMDVRGLDLDETSADDSAQKSGTIMWLSTGATTYTNRATMDAFCAMSVPANKSLTNIHAMVNFSATDEIRDMPDNYGYNPNKPVFMMYQSGAITNISLSGTTDGSVSSNGPIRTWSGLVNHYLISPPFPRHNGGSSPFQGWLQGSGLDPLRIWTASDNSNGFAFADAGANAYAGRLGDSNLPGYSYFQLFWSNGTFLKSTSLRIFCLGEVQN